MLSTNNKVKFGLKNCHYAKATLDPDTNAVTFGTPVAIPGAVNLSLDPEGDTEPFYADDMVYYTTVANNGYSGDLEIALIPESFRKDILKETEWNTLRLRVEGNHIQTWLNGEPMADLEDELIGNTPGRLMLQIHDGNDIKVLWRNFQLTQL